jgi:membrane protein insertase Oxa1/YidC/SpoIIIJ
MNGVSADHTAIVAAILWMMPVGVFIMSVVMPAGISAKIP